MAKKNTDSKNIMPIVGFSVLAVILLIGCLIMMNSMKDEDNQEIEDNVVTSAPVTETTQVNESWETKPVTTQTEAVETTPAHISPQEQVVSENASEVCDMNIILDKSKNKTYKLDLKELADDCDQLNSITFYFSSEDGVSNLGTTKGGFGISVSNKCPVSTDNLWYQPDDFSLEGQGAHSSVTWTIPDEIKEYITVSNGKLQFGYWWSDVDTIKLEKVVCEKTRQKTIPCDGKKDLLILSDLKSAEPDNKLTVPIKDLIGDNQLLQTVSFSVSGNVKDTTCDISARIGVSTGKLFNGMYQSNIIKMTSSNIAADCTWIIPDAVLKSIDPEGVIEFSIVKSNIPEITVEQLSYQWSEK